MAQRTRAALSWPVLALVLLVAGLTFAGATVRADSMDERRVRLGAKFFRYFLAGDAKLETKASADGALHIVVYGTDPRLTKAIAGVLVPADAKKAKVRGLPLRVSTTSDLAIAAGADRPVALFIASAPSTADLDKLIRWGITEHVIVYSPFEGHVERGVLGGISVEANVRLFVNAKTLTATGIEFKPNFMERAKVHN